MYTVCGGEDMLRRDQDSGTAGVNLDYCVEWKLGARITVAEWETAIMAENGPSVATFLRFKSLYCALSLETYSISE